MALERPRAAPRRLLLVTFLIFFVPVVAAWLLNVLAPGWLPFGTVNHGTLVQPVRHIDSAGLTRLDGKAFDADYLNGRWTLVHVITEPCARSCVEALARIRQVRRALGKDMNRVQHLAVITEPTQAPDFHGLGVTPALADPQWLAHFAFDDGGATASPALYLIDPQGYLMMRYPRDVEQHDLYDDLERLLRISKVG